MAILKNCCVTQTLRIGFIIVAVASLLIHGLVGAALRQLFEVVVKIIVNTSSGSTGVQLSVAFASIFNKVDYAMRGMSLLMFISSILLIVSWFLMDKYAGTGQSAGLFSCCFAASPLNNNKRKNLKWYMLPWVVLQPLFFLSLLFGIITSILDLNKLGGFGVVTPIVMFLFLVVVALIQVYCVLVVGCYYLEQTSSVV